MADSSRPFEKILVCNRGEIAIRIFRACTELGIPTVSVYSYEDRFSLHRYKADEAYQVGKEGSPVQSYLDIPAIIAVAKRTNASAIHPGYGFLSERVELHTAAREHNIVFIGPDENTLTVAGDKTQTRALAAQVGVPTIPGSELLSSFEDALRFSKEVGFPVMIKAAFGGGGRGMRLVPTEAELAHSFEAAQTEANAAFGRPEVFIEKYVSRPKHIEVQLLGDGTGEVVHLFERDCSVQRRHQKVVEFAPAISLSEEKRSELYQHALTLGRALKLKSAATAEFLVAEDGTVFFIEINPRIQVEHTVTEEFTGVDIVQTQIRLAAGASLKDLCLEQKNITSSGVAMQCRITTENPQNDFVPDYGRLVAYRSAAGFGVRLDAGSAFTGGVITPFYDSMLVKVTVRAANMKSAINRMRRSLSEFRIRGVNTNIPFLENLLRHEGFESGEARTTFLEEHPEVFKIPRRRDRANRLLRFIGEVIVNGHDAMANLERPKKVREAVAPKIEIQGQELGRHEVTPAPPKGWRDAYRELGREDFLKKVRDENRLLITDTTFRDAHQSLLATRMRTYDMLPVADVLAQNCPQLFSLEMWGGATFDVMLRFLREDPWERLERLRKAVPNILFQMLLRGANGVGYKSYPDNVITEFIKQSHLAGIDIFRIFDSLNNVDRMKNAIDSVRKVGGIAEACICYTGELLREEKHRAAGEISKFDINYYKDLARQLVNEGADIIAIKDMAGLLRPYAAELLVHELRSEVDLPIHFHTHDTAGGQMASYLKAAEAGVDIVDCAFSAMSGVTSQPSLEGMVAALENTERSTGLDFAALSPFSAYWEARRGTYAPFESDLRSATAEVYINEIPGGQYSNFRPQAESLGLGDRWGELKQAYADVNTLFGGIVKVTPSSKVVGDFAIFMVSNNLTIEAVQERAAELDFPASVVEFFQGELGTPFGGFPEPFRQNVLRGKQQFEKSVSERLEPADFAEAQRIASEAVGYDAGIQGALSYLLYPHVYKEYAVSRRTYSNLLLLPTSAYFYGMEEGEEIEVDIEPGKRLFIQLIAVSEPGENGKRTVFYELNGQPRSIEVVDRAIAPDGGGNEQADPENAAHIAAPLAGAVVGFDVEVGSTVAADDPLFTVEAMKMQTIVRAVRAGKIKRLGVSPGSRVNVGDLIVELE